jgi:peroxiredoxin
MTIKVGDTLPEAKFMTPGADGPVPITSDDIFKGKGVDTVACVSVNDVFVMKAWAADQGIGDDILMLADGSGDFTKAIGLEMDASRFGMGSRSQRYSLIAKDGVVEQLNVEQGGEFRVSSAEYLLEQL